MDWQPQSRIATDRQQKKLSILFLISIISFMFLLAERVGDVSIVATAASDSVDRIVR